MNRRTLGVLAAVVLAGVVVLATLALRPNPTAEPAPLRDQAAVVNATAEAEPLALPGGPALVLHPDQPNGRLVIYMHGGAETETSIRTDPQKAPIVAGLLDAGYVVAAALAGGDTWGTDAALTDYAKLQRRLAPTDGTYLLAQSMGGLVGLRAPDVLNDVRAIAAIFPVCDLDSMLDGMFDASIRAAHGDQLDVAVKNLSPAVAEDLDGIAMRFWASPDDTFVPAEENTYACADVADDRGADVEVIETRGQHGDASNFDAAAVLELFR